MARPTVNVDEDVKEMLLDLAEGERKQGEYVAGLIRNAYENRQLGISHHLCPTYGDELVLFWRNAR